jgi:hypothetical protein
MINYKLKTKKGHYPSTLPVPVPHIEIFRICFPLVDRIRQQVVSFPNHALLITKLCGIT